MQHLQKEIQKNLDSLTLTDRLPKWLAAQHLDDLQTDSELLLKLRKFYKQPNAVKISKKMKNEKMLLEIEFYRDQWLDDIHDEEWDWRFTKNLDIGKPCKNPPFFENLIWSLIKF